MIGPLGNAVDDEAKVTAWKWKKKRIQNSEVAQKYETVWFIAKKRTQEFIK